MTTLIHALHSRHALTVWLAAPRTPAALLVLAGTFALAAALFAEHVMGLVPCELCYWSRYAYAAAIGLLMPAMFLKGRPRARAGVLALGGLAFLVGTGISIFHMGVEYHWWQGLTACTGATTGATSIEDLRAAILAAPVARCDQVAWAPLGVSITLWNSLASLGLAVFAAAAARSTAASRV